MHGRCVARGAPGRPAYGFCRKSKPQTKYAALFCDDPAFDDLRMSFIHQVTGLDGGALFGVVKALEETDPERLSGPLKIFYDFLAEYKRIWQRAPALMRGVDNFQPQAWAFSVRAWRERESYYISVDELLLMCHVLEQNCIMFGTRGGTASYRGAALGYDSGPPVLVALDEGDEHGSQRRVRSHFQRLALEADLELAKDIAEEKLQCRQAEGHRPNAVEDARSHDRENAKA